MVRMVFPSAGDREATYRSAADDDFTHDVVSIDA
jgi:hypothetical protein